MIKLSLSQAEIGRMRAYEPHDTYYLSNSWNGRGSVGVILLKEGLTYPITTIFWMAMNLVLLINKTAELVFRSAKLIRFSKEKLQTVKILSVQSLDYLCLLGLIPLARGISVLRKLVALVHPGIYYRRPTLCTWQQQAHFYQTRTKELFQKLFHKSGLSKMEKEAIWNLKKRMTKKLNKEGSFQVKIQIAQACEQRVKDLDQEVNEMKLQEFKRFLG